MDGKLVERLAWETGIDGGIDELQRWDELEKFAEAIAYFERERCAKESEKTVTMEGYENEIARDIRAL